MCGRTYTLVRTLKNELFIFGINKLERQPVQKLSPESFLKICPYSDNILYSTEMSIYRITPEGQTSVVENYNPEADTKEILKGFATSANQLSLLVREKQTTPTVDGGCASLSNAQSSLASKYSVANEHAAKNAQSGANTVMTKEFMSR